MIETKTDFNILLNQADPIILDGGPVSEFDQRGHDITWSLWSAELLVDNSQALSDVHRAYLVG